MSCPVCGPADCARPHGWWCRKRIQNLSTGDVFEQVPILRVLFCDGSTASVMPSDLWRGRSTVGSVLETVVHVLRDGIQQAYEWTLFAGTGESVVSRRTLRRWATLVRTRLIGSAWVWLGPHLGLSWSDQTDAAEQLDRVLDRLTGPVLLGFRAVASCAVVDKPTAPVPRASYATRPVAGRLAPRPPHDPSSPLRPRGSWLPHYRRRGPPHGKHGGSSDD